MLIEKRLQGRACVIAIQIRSILFKTRYDKVFPSGAQERGIIAQRRDVSISNPTTAGSKVGILSFFNGIDRTRNVVIKSATVHV